MARTTILSFVSLALLLPSTLAAPFGFDWFKGNKYDGPWSSYERPHPHIPHPYAPYTMTASSDGGFPTAPSGYTPTATVVSGYTAIATGTGTAVYPTGTGYAKRNLDERHFDFSFPTAFPTGWGPTGTGFSFPTSFPTSFPDSESREPGFGGFAEKEQFGGPRRGHEHPYYPYAPPAYASAPAPTATAAPSFTAPTGSGYPYPTFAY